MTKQLRNFLAPGLVFIAIGISVQAHRLDEYLQASLLEISPGAIHLELNLTPGVESANAIVWLIDLNHDGVISKSEEDSYTKAVTSDLSLQLGNLPLDLRVATVRFPPVSDLRNGMGNIHLQWKAPVSSLRPGDHVLHFRNRHRTDLSAYLVNALLPGSSDIHVTRQDRNKTQSECAIHFTYAPGGVARQSAKGKAWNSLGSPFILGSLLLCTLTVVVFAKQWWPPRNRLG